MIALLAVIILSPVLAVLALLIKLDSPGPVIYRRRVVGRNGEEFDAFKFRSMRVDGDALLAQNSALRMSWERDQKLKTDPRVTRCGVWMRKLSLDELPQLFNVLRGEMSLVGPRMIVRRELDRYGDLAAERMSTKPGITGLWQVSGRSDLDPEARVRLELEHVRKQSFLGDLKILALTIPAVIRGRGAY